MNLRPMRDRVVIKATKVEEKSGGGIILPEDAKKTSTTGEVLAIGVHEKDCSMDIGDMVLFGKFAGTNIKVQNEDFIIMNISEVIAVVQN